MNPTSVISQLLSGLLLAAICSCGPTSGTGGVKVFDTRQEFEQAILDGTVKQGDRIAVREGSVDDIPGLRKVR
jgi:dihydroxyacid dehydratase/phosphogluconate dehydratase